MCSPQSIGALNFSFQTLQKTIFCLSGMWHQWMPISTNIRDTRKFTEVDRSWLRESAGFFAMLTEKGA